MPKAKSNSKKNAGKSAGKTGKSVATALDKPRKKDAGAKLTKAFKNFGPVKELMNSDLGREVLADVLIAAAGAAAAALTKSRGGRADAARDAMQTAAGAVAGVVTDAARSFLPAALVGEDTGSAPTASKPRQLTARKAAPSEAPLVKKKQKAPSPKAASPSVASTASPKIAET